MAKKSVLFDNVLDDLPPRDTAREPTGAYGSRRVEELAAAQAAAVGRAASEHRLISMVDPSSIEIDSLLRDRDLEAARQDPEYKELVDDIREVGIKTPLVVRMKPGGGLLLVEGLRRLAAGLEIGLATVPAVERVYASDQEAVGDMLRENLVRHNPPPMETALLFARLREDGWSDEQVSDLLRAKAWTISRIRTVARGFMPWLAAAYPAYRALPFIDMVKLAPVVEKHEDRRALLVRALTELSEQDGVEAKTVVETIRTVTMTGVWNGGGARTAEPADATPVPRPTPRTAFDPSGAKAALLTHHEGQMVIRFTKRVPDALIERVWKQVEVLVSSGADDLD